MSSIRWGYAVNQWRNTEVDLVRIDQMESAFKVISVGGFRAIEITDNALGGPTVPGGLSAIPAYFGTVRKFLAYLEDCGLDGVCSQFSSLGYANPAKREDHGRMVEAARRTAEALAELKASRLVVRPMGPYWREGPASRETIAVVAEGLGQVARAARESGIELSVQPDFLCAIRSLEDIEALLEATAADEIGLTLDTAELTIAGVDPVAFYARHHHRVNHLHFKDAVATDTLDEYKDDNAERPFWPTPVIEAGKRQGVERWYYEMGAPGGQVDFPALFALLEEHSYDGWVVVESDQSPHAEESVMLNAWYRKRLLAGTAARL